MDSARFIRKRSVLMTWVMTPLISIALIDLAAYSFMERLQVSFTQKKTLEELIPQMTETTQKFNAFISNYRVSGENISSAEDDHQDLMNRAAQAAEFHIRTINLEREIVNPASGTNRINIHIKGDGTEASIARFLYQVKSEDPFLFEDRVNVSRTGLNKGRYQLEATLYKIHIERPGDA